MWERGPASGRPQGLANALLGLGSRIGGRKGPFRLDDRVPELDKRVAGHELLLARSIDDLECADLLLQLEDDTLGGLLADPGDSDEARRVLQRDGAAEIGRRRPGEDR